MHSRGVHAWMNDGYFLLLSCVNKYVTPDNRYMHVIAVDSGCRKTEQQPQGLKNVANMSTAARLKSISEYYDSPGSPGKEDVYT